MVTRSALLAPVALEHPHWQLRKQDPSTQRGTTTRDKVVEFALAVGT